MADEFFDQGTADGATHAGVHQADLAAVGHGKDVQGMSAHFAAQGIDLTHGALFDQLFNHIMEKTKHHRAGNIKLMTMVGGIDKGAWIGVKFQQRNLVVVG